MSYTKANATGVVAGTFEQVRNSHLKNHQDPIYEVFETMEEANLAWDRHRQQELREPPPITPRVVVTEKPGASNLTTDQMTDRLESMEWNSWRTSINMMNFEAPVMSNADDQLDAPRIVTESSTSGTDRRRLPGKGSPWWPYRKPRELTVQHDPPTSPWRGNYYSHDP